MLNGLPYLYAWVIRGQKRDQIIIKLMKVCVTEYYGLHSGTLFFFHLRFNEEQLTFLPFFNILV